MKTVTYEADLAEHKRVYPNAPIYRVVTVSVTTREKIA